MESRINDKNIPVSLLGYGAMRFPCLPAPEGEKNGAIDYEQAQLLIDTAYANGVTYYDTAYMYHGGESEIFLGKALKKYPRESYFVADKMPIWMCKEKEDVERIFLDQLRKTGLEFFDYYLLHALDGKAFERCEEFGAYEFLMKMREQGKIKKIGFSFHGSVTELRHILACHRWDFVQIQLNYLDWLDQSARQQYEAIRGAGLDVIIMEPVRGGKLASPGEEAESLFKAYDGNRSVASWALRFAASLPGVMTVLSGMTTREQVEDNLKTFSDFQPLNEAEYEVIDQAAAAIRKTAVIPCTGCNYCADCPNEVRISGIFALYNDYLTGKLSKEEANKKYAAVPVKADACIKCGKCAEHCPQGISIPDKLHGEISKLFEK